MKVIQGFLNNSWDDLWPESKGVPFGYCWKGTQQALKLRTGWFCRWGEWHWGKEERRGLGQSRAIGISCSSIDSREFKIPLLLHELEKFIDMGLLDRTACTAPVHFHHFQWPLKWLAASVPVFALEIVWCCDIFVLHCHVAVREVMEPSIYILVSICVYNIIYIYEILVSVCISTY